jgi:hypothetical protein
LIEYNLFNFTKTAITFRDGLMTSDVYFGFHARLDIVKIGKGNFAYDRMEGIGLSFFNLEESFCFQLATSSDAFNLERALHRIFKSHSHKERGDLPADGIGEWFSRSILANLDSIVESLSLEIDFKKSAIVTDRPKPVVKKDGISLSALKSKTDYETQYMVECMKDAMSSGEIIFWGEINSYLVFVRWSHKFNKFMDEFSNSGSCGVALPGEEFGVLFLGLRAIFPLSKITGMLKKHNKVIGSERKFTQTEIMEALHPGCYPRIFLKIKAAPRRAP